MLLVGLVCSWMFRFGRVVLGCICLMGLRCAVNCCFDSRVLRLCLCWIGFVCGLLALVGTCYYVCY